VGRHGVVIGDPGRDLVEYAGSRREVSPDDVVPPQGIHEDLRHPVGLRARRWGSDRHQVQPLRRNLRLERRVDAAIVTEPADRRGRPRAVPKPPRHSPVHERLNIDRTKIPRHRHGGQHLTIMAVQGEAELHELPISAGDLNTITAPVLVRHVPLDPPCVRPAGPAPRSARQLPAVEVHHPLNAFEVVRRLKLTLHKRPHPPGLVRRPRPDYRANLRHHNAIIGPRIARRPAHVLTIRTSPADLEYPADQRYRLPVIA